MRRGKPGKRAIVPALMVLALVAGFVLAFLVIGRRGPVSPPTRVVEKTLPPRPKVAIIIDDMGRDMDKLRRILAMKAPVSIAVLPHLRYSRRTAVEAGRGGLDVLLHLPMEPKNSALNDPGKGALLVSMDESFIEKTLEEDLGTVPGAVGVNNHMGSRFTENEALMKGVLEVVKRDGLFFLDSRTTPGTVGSRLARRLGVRSAARDVFLDNRRDYGYIKGQLELLVSIAKKRGTAVAIGHPYPETLRALEDNLDSLRAEGIDVVRVSALVK